MKNRVGLSINQDTNDLELDSGKGLKLVRDAEAVAQHVRQRLMSFEGEWFLSLEDGTPWFDQIMGMKYNPSLAEAVTKTEILGTDGVVAVTSFSVRFDRAIRRLNIRDVEVTTEYGEDVSI